MSAKGLSGYTGSHRQAANIYGDGRNTVPTTSVIGDTDYST